MELDNAWHLFNWSEDGIDLELLDFITEPVRANFKPSDAFPYMEYERDQLPFIYNNVKRLNHEH